MVLNRSAFVPPPKVTSAVVHIVPAAAPEGVRGAVMAQVTASLIAGTPWPIKPVTPEELSPARFLG